VLPHITFKDKLLMILLVHYNWFWFSYIPVDRIVGWNPGNEQKSDVIFCAPLQLL